MRTIDAGLAAHLASGATTLCHCWKIIRRDGVVRGFTDHDVDVSFNAVTYAARTGLDGAEADTALGLSVGGTEISGALNADTLVESDLANGRYDGATIEAWLVNWANVAQRFLIDIGVFGDVRRNDHRFVAEVRGLGTALDEERGRLYQASCSADLGDARCTVSLALLAYSGAASVASADALTLTTGGLASFASGWFTNGEVTFTGGANAGAKAEIKEHRLSGSVATVILWSALASPMAAGDTFTIRAGCDKRFSTCKAKFGNAFNFRGFPHIPGPDQVFTYANGASPLFDGGAVVP
jgi:uncharacterized phage protein (TIGR02218 family)